MTKTVITQRAALRRYLVMMFGGAAAYVGAIMGGALFLEENGPITTLSVGIALTPGIGIVAMLYSMWRYVREVDEVGRFFLNRALVIALFGALAISGVWGVAEMMLAGLPRLPVFWIFPATMVLFGLANAFGQGRGSHCA